MVTIGCCQPLLLCLVNYHGHTRPTTVAHPKAVSSPQLTSTYETDVKAFRAKENSTPKMHSL